ncbi:putative protein phosphatase 2C-like protein 45 [Cardamine amara subsp. amara]|uniref:RNase H type-1 domain-containing protein n=1 Tax=Cardamine amara subsp. amara TaxID=228776 RepID=A0ABD1AU11_CARAN
MILTRIISVRHEVQKWSKPPAGMLKCNVNSSWIYEFQRCGGAWLVRDQFGEVRFHAREIFVPIQNRVAAELRCILWTMLSLYDLHMEMVEIWSDSDSAVQAINFPRDWPKYRSLLDRLHYAQYRFRSCQVKLSSVRANSAVRKISKSVTNEWRYHSYFARGEPTWLHTTIEEDRRS